MISSFLRHAAAAFAGLWLTANAAAHPIPDIPVRGSFATGGDCTVSVEVDPRCFEVNPNEAPSLLNWVFKTITAEQRAAFEQQAKELVQRSVEFYFEPLGQVRPQFAFEFTQPGGAALEKEEDIVVLTGRWKTAVPAGMTGWKVRATPETKLAVVFQNVIDGKTHPRLAVLFPGETSFTLDLTALNANAPTAPSPGAIPATGSSGDAWSTFKSFFAQGFLHVLPEGLDHILFVLGLFLLSRGWKPLLLQVSTFTLAHSVTLVMATLGWVKVSPSVVEPIIALSIAAVAIENIVHPRYTPWRLVVVFVFGLVHGLGFAGALSSLDLPTAALASGLVGFNLGVEGGQLAVIAIAFLATVWVRNPEHYRRWIVIPGSALIAAMGLWWTVQRVLS
jgi:hypothetical protein